MREEFRNSPIRGISAPAPDSKRPKLSVANRAEPSLGGSVELLPVRSRPPSESPRKISRESPSMHGNYEARNACSVARKDKSAPRDGENESGKSRRIRCQSARHVRMRNAGTKASEGSLDLLRYSSCRATAFSMRQDFQRTGISRTLGFRDARRAKRPRPPTRSGRNRRWRT